MKAKVKNIVLKYASDKGFIVPILQDVQKEFNYLPVEALYAVSSELDVPISRIYEVATFYKAFSLTPRGRHCLSLCVGTACHVRGAPNLLKKVSSILDIQENETDTNKMFTLKTVNCLGCCALSPVLQVDDTYSTNPSLPKLKRIFKSLEEQEDCR